VQLPQRTHIIRTYRNPAIFAVCGVLRFAVAGEAVQFPGERGFSTRNLWRMRGFYVEYSQNPILPPMGAELKISPLPALLADIGWKKNMVIMEKCKDISEREFYIKMTKYYGWTKDVLINNIENKAFEKFVTNQTNFDETVPEKYRLQAKLAVKDEYNFDFIEMGLEHSEKELEQGVANNIRAFLLEMGGDFCFIGNRIMTNCQRIFAPCFHRLMRLQPLSWGWTN
jgi:predicted nuclease of restriction endonuclease-like (RecB) superfamily